jgi:hypothetical protein
MVSHLIGEFLFDLQLLGMSIPPWISTSGRRDAHDGLEERTGSNGSEYSLDSSYNGSKDSPDSNDDSWEGRSDSNDDSSEDLLDSNDDSADDPQ